MTVNVSSGGSLPAGFTATVANIGIKDSSDDVVVIAADDDCSAAGVFTKSLFAGPSVVVSRENLMMDPRAAWSSSPRTRTLRTGPTDWLTLARSWR